MTHYSKSVEDLIEEFSHLPGIGPKTAERLVFYLLRQPADQLTSFGNAVHQLKSGIKVCQECQNYSESNPCNICSSSTRDKELLCLVAKPQDLYAMEKTSEYNGVYHVLGGLIDPMRGVTPEKLTLNKLASRLKIHPVKEVILALNSDLPGETTVLYLKKFFAQIDNNITITKLAQGLPIGSDVEYTDEVTLTSALKGRNKLN